MKMKKIRMVAMDMYIWTSVKFLWTQTSFITLMPFYLNLGDYKANIRGNSVQSIHIHSRLPSFSNSKPFFCLVSHILSVSFRLCSYKCNQVSYPVAIFIYTSFITVSINFRSPLQKFAFAFGCFSFGLYGNPL